MTIYAMGLDNDRTLQRFFSQAQDMGEDVVFVNLHAVHRDSWCVTILADAGQSHVCSGDLELSLDSRGSGLTATNGNTVRSSQA
jgi:hypothetical protein